jgi:phosphohistidine phosphatase
MKRLTLMRHAKSSWENDSLDDFDRPLNARGLKAAPEMGRRLRALGDLPELILSSPAARAIETARRVAAEIGHPESRILEVPGLYHASPAKILEILQSLESAAHHVMVVGHNPGMTEFANSLGEIRIDNMPTAGMLCVDLPGEVWSEIDPDGAEAVYFDYPKNPDRPDRAVR